ncbi:MAG TPA: copper resistance CopC family protein, partial [Micromonospora sp.]
MALRFCLVLLPVLATGLCTAGPAAAHFTLAEATPADGSRARGPVTEIRLRYTKAGTPLGSGFTLRDAARNVLPVSRESPDGGQTWLVRPATALPDGQFGLVWKVASADGHPMSGVVEFTVFGAPGAADPSTPTTPDPAPEGGESRASGPQSGTDDEADAEPPGQLVGAAGRWLGYGGALLGVGGIAFALTTLVGTRGDIRTVQ